jgi:hypothetical protein
MAEQAKWRCALSDEVLTDPKEVWIVSRSKIPADFPGAQKLAGEPVCGRFARELRLAGFIVFNLAQAREKSRLRREAEARTSIAALLEAKGQKFPQLEVVSA